LVVGLLVVVCGVWCQLVMATSAFSGSRCFCFLNLNLKMFCTNRKRNVHYFHHGKISDLEWT